VNEIRHERAMECEMKQLDTDKSREKKLTRKIMAMRNMKKRNPRERTNHHSAELQNYSQACQANTVEFNTENEGRSVRK
jgi:hypothetical protein